MLLTPLTFLTAHSTSLLGRETAISCHMAESIMNVEKLYVPLIIGAACKKPRMVRMSNLERVFLEEG